MRKMSDSPFIHVETEIFERKTRWFELKRPKYKYLPQSSWLSLENKILPFKEGDKLYSKGDKQWYKVADIFYFMNNRTLVQTVIVKKCRAGFWNTLQELKNE